MQNYSSSSVGGIALLLPLNGQAQVFSAAIQQGFTAAKNGLTAQQSTPVQDPNAAGQTADGANLNDGVAGTPPDGGSANQNGPVTAPGTSPDPATSGDDGQNPAAASTASSVQVKVYDTSSQPLPALLAQAQRNGASMIIGPLLKNDVEQLYNDNAGAVAAGTLNILALNQPEHLQSRPNICYFALSPEDEARDAANHIHQQGRQQPLPRGALGDKGGEGVFRRLAPGRRRHGAGTALWLLRRA